MASSIAGFSASGSFGLMMIASTSSAIRSRMSVSWPAASVSWLMTVTLSTLPDATAWALTEQIDDSRQPLPTPPPLANPMWYGPAGARSAQRRIAPAARAGRGDDRHDCQTAEHPGSDRSLLDHAYSSSSIGTTIVVVAVDRT